VVRLFDSKKEKEFEKCPLSELTDFIYLKVKSLLSKVGQAKEGNKRFQDAVL